MKKNIRLVLLAVMLVVLVALTAMFTSAATVEVAEGGDLNAAIAGAAAGDTIKINGAVSVATTITINKDLTITGGTVNIAAETAGIGFEVTAGNVVFEDITIKNDIGGGSTALIWIGGAETKPTVTINSGTYYAMNYYAIRAWDGSTLTINGGTFTSGLDYWNSDGTSKDASGGVIELQKSTVTINDGYFSGYRVVMCKGSSYLNVYGGTFRSNPGQDNSCLIAIGATGATLNLYDGDWETTGNFCNLNEAGTVNFHGGTYKHIVGEDPDDTDYFFRESDTNEVITIKGGYFYSEGKAEMFQKNNGYFYITGGTFEYAGSKTMFLGVSGKANGQWEISNIEVKCTGTGKVFTMESGFGLTAKNLTITHTGSGDIYTGYSQFDMSDSKLLANGTGRAVATTGNPNGSFSNCEITAVANDAIVCTGGPKLKFVDCVITSTTGIGAWFKGAATVNMELNTITAQGVGLQLSADTDGASLVLTDNTITSATGLSVDVATGHEVVCYGGVFHDAEGFTNAVVVSNPSFQINNGLTFGSARGASRELKDGDVLYVLQDTLADVYLNANATITVEGQGHKTGALTIAAGNVTVKDLNVVAASGRAITITGTAGTVVITGGSFEATAGTGMRIDTATAKVTISNTSIKAANGGALNCIEVVPSGANADKTRAEIEAGDPLLVVDQVDIIGGASTYSGVLLQANVRIDVLSGKYEGCQAWFRISGCTKGVFNIGNPDATKPQPDCIDASTRAIHVHNGSFGSLVTIYGGRYELTQKSAASYYINCAGADIHVAGGTFIGRINIFSMHDGDVVSPVKISGGKFLMEGAASVVKFSCAMSTVYPENNNFEMAGHVHITGGEFISSGYGDLINVVSTKELGTCVIDGGTFKGADARLVYTQKTTVPVVINGGDFSGEGIRLIWAYHGSNLTINGGTFTLLELPKAAEGEDQKVVDFDHCIVANGGQSPNDVRIYGGTFINQRKGAPQLIFCQNPTTRFYVAGGEYYTINKDGYFIRNMVDLTTGSLKVDAANKKTINGVEYYALALVNATSNNAPLMPIMPSIRSDMQAQGIRFSATVPASVVEALSAQGTLSYGTIIAPAEFVKGMTGDYLTALKALATSKGVDNSKVFVDVVANKGLSKNKNNDVEFHASLVNVKEANYEKKMVGIAYVKVTAADGTVTYHYAAVNTDAALSMTDVATIAFNDNNEAPAYVGAKSYAWRSVKDDNLFNRYPKSTQESFKKYMK